MIGAEKFEQLILKTGYELQQSADRGVKTFMNGGGDKIVVYIKSKSFGTASASFAPSGAKAE